jgi:peptidoglycan-associated lipoprotein
MIMRRDLFNGTRLFLVVLLIFAVNACAKKTIPTKQEFPTESTIGTTEPTSTGAGGIGGINDGQWRELGLNSAAERQEFMKRAQTFENDDVYFAYDAYVLSDEARSVLNKKVEFLKRYPKAKVTIEGHSDQRGTNEYNLALGERRATSAYHYLLNSGVQAAQLSMISYGEERPLATGQDEASWAKNRRDHFVLNL